MKRKLFNVLPVLLGALLVLGFQWINREDDIKFVSMTRVFNESHVKQEYEKQLNAFEQESNSTLQKLQDKIKALQAADEDPEVITSLQQELNRQQAVLSEAYSQRSQNFQSTVWDEINKRVEEFGKKSGYKFILGGTGNGTIMFASQKEDITNEVIDYINKK